MYFDDPTGSPLCIETLDPPLRAGRLARDRSRPSGPATARPVTVASVPVRLFTPVIPFVRHQEDKGALAAVAATPSVMANTIRRSGSRACSSGHDRPRRQRPRSPCLRWRPLAAPRLARRPGRPLCLRDRSEALGGRQAPQGGQVSPLSPVEPLQAERDLAGRVRRDAHGLSRRRLRPVEVDPGHRDPLGQQTLDRRPTPPGYEW
jgi:hypothetical protein